MLWCDEFHLEKADYFYPQIYGIDADYGAPLVLFVEPYKEYKDIEV